MTRSQGMPARSVVLRTAAREACVEEAQDQLVVLEED